VPTASSNATTSATSAAEAPSVVYYAKSTTSEELLELKEITEHKTVKGTKGFHYKCVWADSTREPSWEPEINIKVTADKLLNLYWRSATKSPKPEGSTSGNTTPLKQSTLHNVARKVS
jgi:hypothetical protein